jgi:hypothetical protein
MADVANSICQFCPNHELLFVDLPWSSSSVISILENESNSLLINFIQSIYLLHLNYS